MTTETEHCATCYGAAAKAGREVRQTEVNEFAVCGLCERRIREGLIHYRPSNGTEFHIFLSRCDRCRHFNDDGLSDATVKACKWGVLDKLLDGQFSDSDSPVFWFDPSDLRDGCPAECLRFTDRNEPMGELRDPPPKDCEGQMFLGEMLTVPELVPARVGAAVVTAVGAEDAASA
jgi:hypothetical protein